MARWYDHLLTLLPFEPPYFEAVGLACSYVGHPVIESGADRPTIGLRTVALAAASGLRGIAAEAGMTLVIDRAELVRAADEAGLFVIGVAGT